MEKGGEGREMLEGGERWRGKGGGKGGGGEKASATNKNKSFHIKTILKHYTTSHLSSLFIFTLCFPGGFQVSKMFSSVLLSFERVVKRDVLQ
jgi:hypothetical protein